MDWNELVRDELTPLVPYAPGLRASDVRERIGGGRVHKLSSNENPYGPVPKAVRAMEAVLGRLNLYPDGSARALKTAIAEHMGVDERYVALGNGSNELLRIIAQAVLRPGDEVVYAWPSFVVYPMATQLMGATAVPVPLDASHAHDLDAMLAAITEKTRLVFLCNPNNPTGTIYGKEQFARFMDAVPDHVLVVADEAYFEYVTDAEYPDAMQWFDGQRPLCILRTFSKIYSLAGLRVGYGVLPEAIVSAVDKIREPFNVNTVAQVAAYYSLQDQDEIAWRRESNDRERARLCEALDRLGVSYAVSQTNFVYVETKDSARVFEHLLGHGVIVRNFGTSPALRVGVGSPEDTDATIAALESAVAEFGQL